MTSTHSMSTRRRPQKVYTLEVFFLLVLVGGCVAPASLWLWFRLTPNTVLATAGVGRFLNADKGNDATDVQTTRGTVAVSGTLSALRGSPLIVQRSTKHGTELCVAGVPQSCVALAGAWSGPMHPIPGSRRAVNFYAHGISADNLRFVLYLGSVLTFLCFFGAIAEVIENHTDPDDG